jgi:hypothetical protein
VSGGGRRRGEYTAPILGTVSMMSENFDWTTAANISKQSRADYSGEQGRAGVMARDREAR